MPQTLDWLTETPSQTAGPYVHIGGTPNFAGIAGIYDQDLGQAPFAPDRAGARITITGQVIDGMGAPLRDVLLESWQPGPDGRFGPGAEGFARFAADGDTGVWQLDTLRPGAPAGQAPHIALWIVARGINIGLQTRIYFAGDDHAQDPVLGRIDPPSRRETLMAQETAPGQWQFDIRLQGGDETVFLDI